ncbi:metal-sensitive transcriptional regulator [Corynebacterium falsenii]|uniref:Metal-sensitive transcriptional regulator n=1 Tax=Corynebacterium falsenii TaxID=108486 RepID=A0A418Q5A9_9CORY|nr:metal-sensitive transcriptional regulator [Corynebacterium falsenii]MDC7104611.1 metal-sensitive transcriptional regulator [Corynebacterium falsenii]RIX33734.1 metal-sensitive transcriptional regulator [Corynebacterium falsenii]
MQLNPDDVKPATNRLKRAKGQIEAVTRMLENGEDCKKILQQLTAASKALDRAAFSILATGMEQCLINGDAEERDTMEKLFLSLS